MSEERTICAVCAWRETCKKKFSFDSRGPIKCPDFVRDVTIKVEEEGDQERDRAEVEKSFGEGRP
ncbi:hypothetical protein [Thermosulfuriphilus sp.]